MSRTWLVVFFSFLMVLSSCASRGAAPPAAAEAGKGVAAAAESAKSAKSVEEAKNAKSAKSTKNGENGARAAAGVREMKEVARPGISPEQLYSAMLALEDLGRVRARRLPHTARTMQYLPDGSGADVTARLGEISHEVAGKVFYRLRDRGEDAFAARIAVVAAVPLSDFKKDTEFGRMVAEYLLTDLADRGLEVTELRLGRDINILPRTGEFIMSRNPGELASNVQDLDYVVVSTFTNTRRSLVLQGRLVSLKSGLVESAWRYTMPLSRELLALFTAGREPYTISVKGVAR